MLLKDKEISNLTLTDAIAVSEAGRQHGTFGSQRSTVVFRQFLKFLEDSGVELPFNWTKIKVPKVPQKEQPVFTKEELEQFLEAIPINDSRPPFRRLAIGIRTLCEVLFGTGMRISEALSLRREQWDEIQKKKETKIRGKGGDERIVYFNARSVEWLERYLKERNDISPAMFVNTQGEPMKLVTIKNHLLRIRRKAGAVGKKARFHTFRRTLATYLFEQGANIKDVQIIMGHKSERTTLRHYIKANAKRAKEIHQAILNECPTTSEDF